MNTYGVFMPGAASLSRISAGLTREAKKRVAWFDYYRTHNGSASLTCRRFGISRNTFHKWKRRYNPRLLSSLEDRSRRPKQVRQSKVPQEHIFLVKRLRRQYPYYSKYKLAVIVKRDHGVTLSASTVGRMIKKYDLFFKPKYASKKKRYATKKAIERQHLPRDYGITKPGDLVESDTKHLPFLGKKRYAFVAVDCAGKGVTITLSATPSSIRNATLIEKTKAAFPFAIKAWENDHGPENLKDFHAKLETEEIPQYFAYPYCPDDKPYVERVIGTLEREFVQQGNLVSDIVEQQKRIDAWLDEYHNFRPHQSLGYLTPNEYYLKVIGKTVKV